MYLQITTRCQMNCAHCGFSCGKSGKDMSYRVFSHALQLCEDYGELTTLGGGEPTLHPKFDQFLLMAIATTTQISSPPLVITNGGITPRALRLAQLSKSGIVLAALSLDEYHDPIDHRVIDAFKSLGKSESIWDTTNGGTSSPKPHGRAIKLLGLNPEDIDHNGSDCICSDSFVKPDGNIYQCGCADAPKIGDVFNGYNTPMIGDCCHSLYFVDECSKNPKYEHLLV